MKCPECESEQPEDAILCEECGLSFEMWRQANPEPVKADPSPEPVMTFPAPEEDKPAPEEKQTPKEEATQKETPAPAKTEPMPEPETTEPSQAKSIEEPISGNKKSFKWTPLYSAGLGLSAALALGGLFLSHRASKPAPNPTEGNALPVGTLTSAVSSTPGTGTPTASPQATGLPTEASAKAGTSENSLVLKTPTPLSNILPAKTHKEKPVPTSTPTPENIIQPEEPSPTTTAKPAPSSPTEVPVSAIWADSPTPSPETASPVPTTNTSAPAAATPAATPISSPSDILESPEPKKTAAPSSTP